MIAKIVEIRSNAKHTKDLSDRLDEVETKIKEIKNLSNDRKDLDNPLDEVKVKINEMKNNLKNTKYQDDRLDDIEKKIKEMKSNIIKTENLDSLINDMVKKVEEMKSNIINTENLGNRLYELEKKIGEIRSSTQNATELNNQLDELEKNIKDVYPIGGLSHDDLMFLVNCTDPEGPKFKENEQKIADLKNIIHSYEMPDLDFLKEYLLFTKENISSKEFRSPISNNSLTKEEILTSINKIKSLSTDYGKEIAKLDETLSSLLQNTQCFVCDDNKGSTEYEKCVNDMKNRLFYSVDGKNLSAFTKLTDLYEHVKACKFYFEILKRFSEKNYEKTENYKKESIYPQDMAFYMECTDCSDFETETEAHIATKTIGRIKKGENDDLQYRNLANSGYKIIIGSINNIKNLYNKDLTNPLKTLLAKVKEAATGSPEFTEFKELQVKNAEMIRKKKWKFV